MKPISIDNSNSNVCCYDSLNMIHATDNQIIKLNVNSFNISFIDILCNIWRFNKNEKLVFKAIFKALENNITPNKFTITKECAACTDKNIITYTRAIDSLKLGSVIIVNVNGDIQLSDSYNIFKYMKNRSKETIKYITIKL